MDPEMERLRSAYPEPWRLGELHAEDQMEWLRGERRIWTPDSINEYATHTANQAVQIFKVASFKKGYVYDDPDVKSAVAWGFALHLIALLKGYITSGEATADQIAIAEHLSEWERGRKLAEESFKSDPERWTDAELTGEGMALHLDMVGPQFELRGIAGERGFIARMAELILERISAGWPPPP